jgi:hypothetical protein
MIVEESSYHGNINLKPIGYKHNFTPEQLTELALCEEDPIYFIENYCMIVSLDEGLIPFKLYECQKRKVHHILDNRKAILMEGRQQGKTLLRVFSGIHCFRMQKLLLFLRIRLLLLAKS